MAHFERQTKYHEVDEYPSGEPLAKRPRFNGYRGPVEPMDELNQAGAIPMVPGSQVQRDSSGTRPNYIDVTFTDAWSDVPDEVKGKLANIHGSGTQSDPTRQDQTEAHIPITDTFIAMASDLPDKFHVKYAMEGEVVLFRVPITREERIEEEKRQKENPGMYFMITTAAYAALTQGAGEVTGKTPQLFGKRLDKRGEVEARTDVYGNDAKVPDDEAFVDMSYLCPAGTAFVPGGVFQSIAGKTGMNPVVNLAIDGLCDVRNVWGELNDGAAPKIGMNLGFRAHVDVTNFDHLRKGKSVRDHLRCAAGVYDKLGEALLWLKNVCMGTAPIGMPYGDVQARMTAQTNGSFRPVAEEWLAPTPSTTEYPMGGSSAEERTRIRNLLYTQQDFDGKAGHERVHLLAELMQILARSDPFNAESSIPAEVRTAAYDVCIDFVGELSKRFNDSAPLRVIGARAESKELLRNAVQTTSPWPTIYGLEIIDLVSKGVLEDYKDHTDRTKHGLRNMYSFGPALTEQEKDGTSGVMAGPLFIIGRVTNMKEGSSGKTGRVPLAQFNQYTQPPSNQLPFNSWIQMILSPNMGVPIYPSEMGTGSH